MGALQGETGRGKNVYCGWRPRSLEHDYELTKWCRCYPGLEYERGNELERGADAIAWSDAAKAYLELDTGSMPLERVRQRWEQYRDSDGYLIVITTTEKRLRQLMDVSQCVKEVALFCRLDDVRRSPGGAVYFTTAGVAIPLGEVL